MVEAFKQAVKAWVVIDDHMASLAKQIRDLRREKEGLAATILETMARENIEACNVGEDKIRLCNSKRKKPLKPDTVRTKLIELLAGDEDRASAALREIQGARETVTVPKLRRVRPRGGKTEEGDDEEDE